MPGPSVQGLAQQQVVAQLARSHALDVVECRPIYEHVNTVYLVRCRDGPRAILKVYRPGAWASEQVAWEADLVRHLAAAGAPVAGIIPGRNGDLVTSMNVGGRQTATVLFECAPGDKPQPPTSDLYRRLGRAAGMIHNASDTFASAHPRRLMDLNAIIDEPLAAMRPSLTGHGGQNWEYASELASRLRQRLSALARQGLDWGAVISISRLTTSTTMTACSRCSTSVLPPPVGARQSRAGCISSPPMAGPTSGMPTVRGTRTCGHLRPSTLRRFPTLCLPQGSRISPGAWVARRHRWP